MSVQLEKGDGSGVGNGNHIALAKGSGSRTHLPRAKPAVVRRGRSQLCSPGRGSREGPLRS